MKKRLDWADYAKFIGITLMLLGHNELGNHLLFDWIYTFHMPLFFILAGYFTSSKQLNYRQFIRKNANQLIVPYVFFYILTLPFGLYVIYSHQYNHPFESLFELFTKPIIGLFLVRSTDFSFHTNGPSWFFVALFLSKLLFHFSSLYNYSKKTLLVTNISILALYFILQQWPCGGYFRVTTALLGYPFITIGYILKQYNIVDKISNLKIPYKFGISVVCYSLCIVGALVNGHVEFSAANYGNNIGVMYVCGLLGSIGTISISMILPSLGHILFIGANTGVILGLHSMVQTTIRYILLYTIGLPLSNYTTAWACIIVAFTLLVLYPVILFMNRYVPKFIGK